MRAPTAVAALILTACATQPQTDGSPTPPAAESGSLVSVSPAKSVRAPRTSRSLNARPAVRATPRASLIGSRRMPPPRRSLPVGFNTWRHSPTALRVLACESHSNYQDDTGNRHYGAWQVTAAWWRTYGGDPAYLNIPPHRRFLAPPAMQDAVAYRGWLTRGWSAWACA